MKKTTKRLISMLLGSAMALSLTACGGGAPSAGGESSGGSSSGVEINVTTTYAGEDSNAQNFKDAVAAWEAETGNSVSDTSATSDESFKTRILTDFETGSEPDVLFFFNGADADDFVSAGKVVPIDEIRETYPEYASNMNDDLIAASPADGVKYAVPVNGYWEGLFCNMEVLEAAGVEKPTADTTWDDFLGICQKIKDAGFTPIAVSLSTIPHYWWEFAIFNEQTPEQHLTIPGSADDETGKQWVSGIEEIKNLYDLGYLPDNTLSATDDETVAMFTEGKAAFLLDGSWKVGGITGACQSDPDDPATLDTEKLDKFDITYFPGKGNRKTTDMIGGLSMGYYVTRKAWDDPEKQAVAISFVEYMTSDEIVPKFAQHTASALKKAPEVDKSSFTSLQIKAMDWMSGVTSLTGAVQDLFNGECRVSTFDGMPDIVTGTVSAHDAVQVGIDTYIESQE